jgi:hypothetical protein
VWAWGSARSGVLGDCVDGLVTEEAPPFHILDDGIDDDTAETEAPLPLLYQPVPAIVAGLVGKHVVQVGARGLVGLGFCFMG